MENTKIEALSKSKTIDYGEEILENFWLTQKNISSNKIEDSPLTCEKIEHIRETLRSAQHSICIQTEYLNSEEITKICLEMASQVRIYIIVNDVESQQQIKSFTSLASTCLIRHGFSTTGSFILVDPNYSESRGVFLTAPLTESSLYSPSNLMLDLETKQIEEFYHYFCDNFWNHCRYEVFSKNDLRSYRESSPAPINMIKPAGDFTDSSFIHERLKELINLGKTAKICLPQVMNLSCISNLENISQSTIITSLSGNSPNLLSSLAKGNSIYSLEISFFHFWLFPHEGYLFPGSVISNNVNLYALKLTRGQLQEMKKFFSLLQQSSKFKFIDSQKKNLTTQPIRLIDNLEQDIQIQQEENLNLNSIIVNDLINQDDMRKTTPNKFPNPGYSCQVHYSWMVHPPCLPKKSKPDSLYQAWDEINKSYQRKLEETQSRAKAIDSKKSSISEKLLDGLKSLFVGKSKQVSETLQTLEQMSKKELSSMSSYEREQLIKQINDFEKNLDKSNQEIEDKIQEEQQRQKWEEKRRELEKNKKETEEEITKRQQEIADFEEAYSQKRISKKEVWETAIQEMSKELEISPDKWENLYQEIQDFIGQKRNKEEKKKAREKIFEAKEKLSKFNKVNQILSTFDNSQEAERQNLQKKIQSQEREKERLEQSLKEHGERFIYNKSQSTENRSSLRSLQKKSSKYKSPKEFTLSFPEKLPLVGTLYKKEKQRYLIIEHWEELLQAKEEASRLDAKICVKKE